MAEDKELLKAGEQNPKSEKERKKEEKNQLLVKRKKSLLNQQLPRLKLNQINRK